MMPHDVSKSPPQRVAEVSTEPVRIPADSLHLEGDLSVPAGAYGIVLFAHGSGSSRHSPRNQLVAAKLREAGLATLLMDLLTEQEDAVYARRFDLKLLTPRLLAATRWVAGHSRTAGLSVGYFGASTGAAVALLAAAEPGSSIRAVVSRGGRPDLVGSTLREVRVPTLLIVGGLDDVVIDLNQQAFQALAARDKNLKIVPGASHLFEEPGTLEEVAGLAAAWFMRFLSRPR